jgi:hypothetical protein
MNQSIFITHVNVLIYLLFHANLMFHVFKKLVAYRLF